MKEKQIEALTMLAYYQSIDTLKTGEGDSLNIATVIFENYNMPLIGNCRSNCIRPFQLNNARCRDAACRKAAIKLYLRCRSGCRSPH